MDTVQEIAALMEGLKLKVLVAYDDYYSREYKLDFYNWTLEVKDYLAGVPNSGKPIIINYQHLEDAPEKVHKFLHKYLIKKYVTFCHDQQEKQWLKDLGITVDE